MITGATIKSKRVAAGIPGQILCSRVGFARSRLSAIERGYCTLQPEEFARIDKVLEDLIQAKGFIDKVAASVGWPTGARRDQ